MQKINKLLVIPCSLGVTLLLNLFVNNFAWASETTTEASSTVMFDLNQTLGIAVEPNISIQVDPNASGASSYNTTDLTIASNNVSGYRMYLTTLDGTEYLTHTVDNSYKIPSTAGGLTLANFTNNTWGYNLTRVKDWNINEFDTYTFSAVPTSTTSEPQASYDSPVTDTFKLTFGAKIDTTLYSGKYANVIKISVISDVGVADTISTIGTMQDMSPEICAASALQETKQLIDIRDGNKYWVAKLADDNCWMTQNLDLDLSTSQALTSVDSDVSSSWTPSINTLVDLPTVGTSYTNPYSWDFGKYVKSNPLGSTVNDYCETTTSLGINACISAGWVDVSSGYNDDYVAFGSDGNLDAVDESNRKYDAHYSIGNYYNYYAATAGSGGIITSGNASDSICPKGWSLPIGGNSTASGSFNHLITVIYKAGNNIEGATIVQQSPLYFIRAGRVLPGTSLNHAGDWGDYQSATAYDGTFRYNFYFASSYVNSIDYAGRAFGSSVRCVAR